MLILAAALLLAGCGTDDQPGHPAVYDRINTLTDCAALQAEFDTAMDNAEARPAGDEHGKMSLSYAEAADDRMKDLGCYG